MRSQATKTQPKKESLVKPTFKQHSPTKQVKKKPIAASKKLKNLIEATVLKSVKKKNLSRPQKKNEDSPDKHSPKADKSRSDSSKSPLSTRSNSPTKKIKNENKEKKVTVKKAAVTITKKKNIKEIKPAKKVLTESKKTQSGDEIKYKINSEHVKIKKSKPIKAKTIIKKMPTSGTKKKPITPARPEKSIVEPNKKDESSVSAKPTDEFVQKLQSEDPLAITPTDTNQLAVASISDTPEKSNKNNTGQNNASVNAKEPLSTPQKSKTDTERPPKFFTSTRSPRIVDIDLKSCKTTKTNISLTDKFLSMKLPDKKDVVQKNKTGESSAVPTEAEIDVYTFTDYKVDSPKSILSDFRSPINKNVGRVRPIARVKGTVIDINKLDSDKKKYSPHRPIEEVVKQLKAGKKAEEAKLLAFTDNKLDNSNSSTTTSSSEPGTLPETREHSNNDKPKSVVSKSYKMVARKSIPGASTPRTNLTDSEGISKASTSSTPTAPAVKTFVKKRSKKASKKMTQTSKKSTAKSKMSDDELDHSTFSLNTSSTSPGYSSSDESVSSNDEAKESSDSEDNTNNKLKKNRMKGMRIVDSERKSTSKDLEALSPDSLTDLKESSGLIGDEKPTKRRLKLLSMWTGPKKHRMASLNALAKVHCLYENESRTHMELGLMRTVERNIPTTAPKPPGPKKKPHKPEKHDSTSESEYEKKVKLHLESSEEDTPPPSTRNLRVVPGARGSGKYWDHKSSTSSSEDSEVDYKKKTQFAEKKKPVAKTVTPNKSDSEKPPPKMKKTAGVPIKKKRNRNEVVMDLKDMVVQKRMASLNASAIIAASNEKRSSKSSKDETTTSDSNSDKDETFAKKSKNGVGSGVKSEAGIKIDECKKEEGTSPKQKMEVIVNQDTDVTITGVYSTHHEGFCTVSGLQYRISSTSHTQTTATASADKEGCSHEDTARYTPLNALSSMQPPADQAAALHHPHPVHEHRGLSGLGRRPGCSSAFSAPPPNAQHDPGKLPASSPYDMAPPLSPIGYYQPAGPLIKEGSAEADGRALARYHAPHYHAPPHPQMLQHYGSPYYPADLCYGGRYYRPAGPPGYLPAPPPQPDAQMVGVGGEPYPPAQYYNGPPCYHNSPQRVPYLEYRGCPCPINTCPKNVLIGPATGKPPNSGGPADTISAPVVPPGGAFRPRARAARGPEQEPAINNGKDPPRDEPPAAADAPHLRYRPPLVPPAFSGVSPKREMYPDACEEFRLATDGPGLPAEALGPPSPARGSAGACVPQPPLAPPPQRRARLGKAMARKTLVGDDTATLLLSPVATPPSQAAAAPDTDDDVLVLSSPDVECVPIDLSSSDETERRDSRDRLLTDVKKENEGPDGGVTVRKLPATDTTALREHNSPCTPLVPSLETTKPPESPKPQATKRRYSRPKLEIEPSMEIVDGRPTNGIGEHVKLQKRRKFVPETETTASRETMDKGAEVVETKKKPVTPKSKRVPKLETASKRCNKRKASSGTDAPPSKKLELEVPKTDDARLLSPAAVSEPLKKDKVTTKPKNRSAQLLDKLIRKNSVDRSDAPGSDYELNPAELFPPPPVSLVDRTHNGVKKVLNINNNIVDETITINDTRPILELSPPRLIADRLLAKLAAAKVAKEKPSAKSSGNNILENTAVKLLTEKVLKTQIENSNSKTLSDKPNSKLISEKNANAKVPVDTSSISIDKINSSILEKHSSETSVDTNNTDNHCVKSSEKPFTLTEKLKPIEKLTILNKPDIIKQDKTTRLLSPKPENIKPIEKSGKLLSPKSDIIKPSEKTVKLLCSKPDVNKLLVSKRPPTETVAVEPAELPEDVCTKPAEIAPVVPRRAQRRRRSGIRRRGRLSLHGPSHFSAAAGDEGPSATRVTPRWSNGWLWEGEPYLSKVYLNNDMRLDRVRRCYSAMVHAAGDRVRRGDCVLLRAAARRGPEQPFVARVAHLWENPDDGEMMVSLVWYYRPEHTEHGRLGGDAPDEVFASRHRDANSVACIEDKCYVLTFNEYCRYKKKLKASEEGITIPQSMVPPMPACEVTAAVAPNDTKLPPNVSPELVLFCRKIYDFRSKKIQIPNK